MDTFEYEQKYLVSNVIKGELWDREHIIYQWYKQKSDNGSIKNKIVFDLTSLKIIYVRVKKEILMLGKSDKAIEYLNLNELEPEEMIGVPFILKRRAISNKIFLDRFIRSNAKTDYLLEYEDNNENSTELQRFEPLKNVTLDMNYYNQNMCVSFTKKDSEHLKFLLNVFP